MCPDRKLVLAALLAGLHGLPAGAQDEVPFITTPDGVTTAMLTLAGVGPRDHVVDLGSGDGRIVIAAAQRFGATGLGVEIVPDLVRRSRERALAAGVEQRAVFREQDIFAADLSGATVVTLYLLPAVNLQLRPRLLTLAPGTRIVSHDWHMGDWTPDESVSVAAPDKTIGREKLSRVHLWHVPARVQGLWCAAGAQIEVTQRFQRFSATFSVEGRGAAPALVVDGSIRGTTLQSNGAQPLEMVAEGDVLRVVDSGLVPDWAQRRFGRAVGGRCP